MMRLQDELKLAYLFVSHDLAVVRHVSHRVAVMYLGRIVELADKRALFATPLHPYSEALLSAVPILDPNAKQKRIRLSGVVPSAINPPSGCRFQTRCPRKLGQICEQQEPPAHNFGDGHLIYCHIPADELSRVEPVVAPRQS